MSKLGWRYDLERWHNVAATAKPFKLKGGLVIPNHIDHREWLEAKDQGNQGSCSGCARANVGAVLNFYDTGGGVEELSRQYCYLTNQRVDGITGDEGATIDGAIRAAKEWGWCRESLFPYPDRYINKIPKKAIEEGKQHKLLYHSLVTGYDEGHAGLASCSGAIQIGIWWLKSWAENTSGVIESYEPSRDVKLGGHSVAILGYSKRKKRGKNYWWLKNSHGKGWGKDGWAEVSPDAIEAALPDPMTMFVFMSDMEEYRQRPYPTPR